MEKNKKKKAATGAPKGAKRLSDYKSRETAAATSPVDVALRKGSGKTKDAARKG